MRWLLVPPLLTLGVGAVWMLTMFFDGRGLGFLVLGLIFLHMLIGTWRDVWGRGRT